MTLEEVQAMSDQELRLKVAHIVGWTDICELDDALCDIEDIGKKWQGRIQSDNGNALVHLSRLQVIPNYHCDLNAMHEAEKVLDGVILSPLRSYVYLDHLADITGTSHAGVQQEIVMATARQRAEAFVLTMEK